MNTSLVSQKTLLINVTLLVFLCQTAPSLHSATINQPDLKMREILQRTLKNAGSFKDRYDAEVWLLDMSTRLTPYMKQPKERLTLLRVVHREATRFGLRPELVLSVIHVESLFNRYAVSSAGAQGLMQVMPFWKKEIGAPSDNLINLETNIRYGCTILKAYLEREKGNERLALARYNGSVGKNWYPERVFNAWKKHWFVQS